MYKLVTDEVIRQKLVRQSYAAWFEVTGRFVYDLLSTRDDFSMPSFVRMLLHKHKKYGAKPIREWGPLGVIIRISSKLNRYINMHEAPGQAKPDDEDTLADILGYCVLGLLLEMESGK